MKKVGYVTASYPNGYSNKEYFSFDLLYIGFCWTTFEGRKLRIVEMSGDKNEI